MWSSPLQGTIKKGSEVLAILDEAVEINKLGQRNLWVLYGKSNSGKTWLAATFPKPLLYLQIGDDGSNTIASVEGVKAIRLDKVRDPKTGKEQNANPVQRLKDLSKELLRDKQYKTIVVDTFSFVVNEWTDEKVISKGKRMTQQLWGDLKVDQEELVKLMYKVARKHIVVLTCHESVDNIEGMEDEITPDVRPSVSKGARTYLEGMANYGIHTTKIIKEVTSGNGTKEVVKYAADIGPNPYYWTKLQIDPSIKVPKRVINPTYEKFMQIIGAVEE